MIQININISEKHALVDMPPVIVCGNADYTIKFTFDEEWENGAAKTARFVYIRNRVVQYQDVPFTGDTVAVPVLADIKEVMVGVFAGNLVTTTPARIPCERSIRCGTSTPEDPTPAQYDEIMALINGMRIDDERIAALESSVADLLYNPMAINSFSNNVNTAEKGSTVDTVTLSWTMNKVPKALSLDSAAIDPALASKELAGLGITADKTWVLTAIDERGAKVSKTTTIKFYNGVYYGAAANPESPEALTKVLTGNRKRGFTVTAAPGEYIWYALPVSLGECTFKVGGFEGGFDLMATMDFENTHGFTEPYRVYRSANAGLGKTTVEVI